MSALLGICLFGTYEGQAAIELGERASGINGDTGRTYPFRIDDGLIHPDNLIRGIVEDRLCGVPVEVISARFHLTVAEIVRQGALLLKAETGIKKVALSGGTWQNRLLFREAKRMLADSGFEVFYHRRVPANDGGIALGQAMVAHWKAKNGNSGRDSRKTKESEV